MNFVQFAPDVVWNAVAANDPLRQVEFAPPLKHSDGGLTHPGHLLQVVIVVVEDFLEDFSFDAKCGKEHDQLSVQVAEGVGLTAKTGMT